MPFAITEFDDLALPEYLDRSDTQDMGVARAATDFVALPGGGFVDNYGDADSPRQLSTITKRCVLYDTGGDTVRVQIEALRGKVGKRGRLEAVWHDDVVRWCWARLMSVAHPRPFNARRLHLPVDVSFMPATGVWYAENEVEDETIFSGSSTDEDVVIAHPGTANVVDAVIQYKSPVTSALTLTIENERTAQKLVVDVAGITTNETIIIDIGNKTVRLHKLPTAISSIRRSGTTVTVTSTSHGLSVADNVRVRGTSYDGFYAVATVPNANSFTVEAEPTVKAPSGPESPASGEAVEIDNILFSNTTFSDPAEWLALLPGNNTLRVQCTDDLNGGTFTVIFNPAYA